MTQRWQSLCWILCLAGFFLIKGNHDRCHTKKFTDKFVKVAEYMEIKDNGRNVVLSHYPIPCFKNHFYGWYHLYGHVHNSFEFNMMEHDKFLMQELYSRPCNMFNVGAMMPWMDYTPRTLDQIELLSSGYKAEAGGIPIHSQFIGKTSNKKPLSDRGF